MKKQALTLAAGTLTALASLAPTAASATGVCYAFTENAPQFANTVDGGPPLVLRYLSTQVGALTTDAESRDFGHLKQTAYSLVGKATLLLEPCINGTNPQQCDPANPSVFRQVRLMTTVDGTIIVGRPLTNTSQTVDPPGAHMGVNVHILRRIPELGVYFPIGPAVMECTSDQSQPNPREWRCNLKLDINEYIGGDGDFFFAIGLIRPFTLVKLQPGTAKACSVFQDGQPYVPDA
jgi:hypothetical protein